MTKGKLAWALVVVLAILHYDFWYWDDRTLVLGFLPVGLFFQALISLGAGILFSTAIILLLVPALYLILEDLRALLGRAVPTTAPAAHSSEA